MTRYGNIHNDRCLSRFLCYTTKITVLLFCRNLVTYVTCWYVTARVCVGGAENKSNMWRMSSAGRRRYGGRCKKRCIWVAVRTTWDGQRWRWFGAVHGFNTEVTHRFLNHHICVYPYLICYCQLQSSTKFFVELICLSAKNALVSLTLILANSACNVCSRYSYLYLAYTSIGNVTAVEFLHSLKMQCKTNVLIKYISDFQISTRNILDCDVDDRVFQFYTELVERITITFM